MENELTFTREVDPTYRPAVLLDSGAYTAWRTNKPIDRSKYADFIHQYKAGLAAYINLDHIILEDREEAARRSLDNFKYLQGRGLDPIPVYHQGEDIKWLHKMLDAGAHYVALAGASTLRSVRKETQWYDGVWNSLVNAGGLPYVKVHGLGDTKLSSLLSYPWHSVDSSSWAQSTGKGALVHINHLGRRLSFGVRRDGRSLKSARDLEAFRGEEREAMRKLLAQYNISYDRLLKRASEDHVYRLFLGMVHYKQMMDQVNEKSRPRLPLTGIFERTRRGSNKTEIAKEPLRIYLASWMSYEFSSVFQAGRYPFVLLSYAWMGGTSNNKLRYGLQFINGDDPRDYKASARRRTQGEGAGEGSQAVLRTVRPKRPGGPPPVSSDGKRPHLNRDSARQHSSNNTRSETERKVRRRR